MLLLALRRLITAGAALALACGCGDAPASADPDPIDEVAAWLGDADYRASALADSLVSHDNGYSRLRLEQYEAWSQLPEYNPSARPVTVDDFGRFARSPRLVTEAEKQALDVDVEITWDALVDLGRLAFERYPVDLDGAMTVALRDAETAERLGIWTDDRGRVGGLLRVATADGAETTGMSCATCHATTDERGQLVHGLSNASLDRAGISSLASGRGDARGPGSWPVGTLDVTPDGIDNPVAIGDLRAVRHQTHLHWAGTVRNGLVPLALRIETLIITSHEQALRPPRVVPMAMAAYLWSLPTPTPELDVADPRGAELFEQHCARCHGDGLAPGSPVPLDEVGTDDAAGRRSSRATGAWRVPTLVGVGTRTQLLHTGAVRELDDLFLPARLQTTQGHAFGTDLNDEDREALVRWLRSR